jgi:Fe-S cluster assembly protein SufD
MSALDTARDRYLERFERFESQLGDDPSWLRSLRRDAAGCFAERGLPDRKLEEWRYTNVSALAKPDFELAEPGIAGASRDAIETVATPVFACGLYVLVDGHFAPELSSPLALSDGVRVESLAWLRREAPERLEASLASLAAPKEHPFAALNTAFLDDGAVVQVPRGADLEQPVHVVFVSTAGGPPRVRHPRVLVVAEPGSRVRLIQDHVSLADDAGFTNAVTEVRVEENASVDLILLQREGAGTFHVANVSARVERNARFSSHTMAFGGRLLRNDLAVLLADQGADCTLNGLFIGYGRQLIDNHTLVDHAMPHGTSRELYKGILGGQARGVFRGKVIVRPDAQKTDARQSNANLLLSDGAEVDTKPQLEIHADDVRCSHGSSIGQLDEAALFYLRSRGIDESAARDLLVRGFASEILGELPVAALAEGLGDAIDALLARRENP